MEIEKCEKSIKCDFYGCPDMAEYTLKTKKIMGSKMYFCESCLTQLYKAIGTFIIPKSPKTPFKQIKKK